MTHAAMPTPASAPLPDELHAIPLPTLAIRANKEHEAAEVFAKSALEHARNAGSMLLAAKDRVEHGNWENWLRANFRGSQRTARVYMRIASRWSDLTAKRQRAADLSVRGAAALLATPLAKLPKKPMLPNWLPGVGQMAIGKILHDGEHRTYIIGRSKEASVWLQIYRLAATEADGPGILEGTKRGIHVESAESFLRKVLHEDRASDIEWTVNDTEPADENMLQLCHKLLNPASPLDELGQNIDASADVADGEVMEEEL